MGDKPLDFWRPREYILAVDSIEALAEHTGAKRNCLYYPTANATAADIKSLADQYPTADISVLLTGTVSVNELAEAKLYIAQHKYLIRLGLLLPDQPDHYEHTFTYLNFAAIAQPSAGLVEYAAEIETPVYKFVTLDKNTSIPDFLADYYQQKNPLLPLIYLPSNKSSAP
ncbi:hypothetical protein NO2_0026 [Candidatus Termititenax persephonae]|uniref:Uncharacterized protein n=1 Tax=Candidatus Termititenax persephonae TaxID=2218525 RepID=A0A388TGJ2_9BACT|nr:hypothetical protein NO2_0026 [Candidatus Termititenax persephonae]